MPTLPTAKDLGVVEPTPSRQIATYQGGIAEQGAQQAAAGFNDLGKGVISAATAVADQTANVWARDAGAQYMLDVNKLGEDYRQKEGMDAYSAYNDHAAAVADLRQKAIAAAPNPLSGRLLADQASFVMSRALASAQSYATSQFKVGNERSIQAQIAAKTAFAVNNQNDPDTVGAAEGAIRKSALDIAELHGLHGADADTVAQQEVGKYYRTLLGDMAVRNPSQASALFAQVRDHMDGPSQTAIDQHLKAQGDQNIGTGAAMQAWGQSGSGLGAAIQAAVARVPGSNADTLARSARIESANGSGLGKPGDNGGGYFQFVKSTGGQYGVSAASPIEDQATAAARLQVDNRASLTKLLGRTPTEAEVYLAHQQGAGGAASLLLNPTLPATMARAKASDGNGNAVLTNGGVPGQTASDFVNMWRDKFNAAGPPPGASNDAQDHTTDRAAGFGNLLAQYQAGKLSETQFSLAVTKLSQLQAIDTKVKQDAAEQAFNEYIPKALAAPGTFDMNAMLQDGRLTGVQKNQLYGIVERAVKGNTDKPTEVSQQVRTLLLDGIREGSISGTAPLVDAVAHRGLSTGDYNFVKGILDQSQTDNGRSLAAQTTELFKAVEKDITATPFAGMQNPGAGVDMLKFKAYAYQKIAEAQKTGKVADLFDPNSSSFLGDEKVIAQFKSDLKEIMRRKTTGMATGDASKPPVDLSTKAGILDARARNLIDYDTAAAALEKVGIGYAPTGANRVPVTP